MVDFKDMPPGREMDALVAQKVMGWESVGQAVNEDRDFYGRPPEEVAVYRVPRFSVVLITAWEVHTQMLKLDHHSSQYNAYVEALRDADAFFLPAAETALAICRAALPAVHAE